MGTLAMLAPILALASRQGPQAVAGLLQGYQAAQQQAMAQQRQKMLDARQASNDQIDQQLKQAQIANIGADNARADTTLKDAELNRRLAVMQQIEKGYGNLETPEDVTRYGQAMTPFAQQYGIEPGAIQAIAPQPTTLQKKAAEKKINQLKAQFGELHWMEQGQRFVHDLSNGEKSVPFTKVLEYAGYAKDPNAPPESDLPDMSKSGLEIQAAEALKRGDTATYDRLLKIRKEMGQADDRPRVEDEPLDATKVMSAAQAILEKRMAPSQLNLVGGFGQQAARFRQAVVNQVNATDPHFNWQAAESSYQFGKNSGTQTTVRYIDNISKTIPMLRAANQTFKRSNLQFVNGILQTTQRQIGNVDVADFQFKLTLLADEIAKVLQGGGTGSATSDAKLRQAQALLDGKMTANQLETVLNAAQDMLSVRRQSLTSGTFMDNTGQPPTAPAGLPTVGSQFQGGTVLKIEKVK